MKSREEFQTPLDDTAYQNEILQYVSRTFALTIPQLPEPLCTVVANAYLLCRIADTIEDDKSMSAEQKKEYSELFIAVVKGAETADTFAENLFPLLSPTATVAEHDLIANTAPVIRLTHGFNERQRSALERCVKIMADGMVRYQDAETLDGVADQNDMDQYCYYVAGVVGELLTELFCDHSPEIDAHRNEMMKLGVSFGQGLQMTNILKDIWEDHERGACWLPRNVFEKHGVDIPHKKPGKMGEGFNDALIELLGIAHAHVHNALRYTLMIPAKEKGLRKFCLWALGMSVLTLLKIRQHPDFTDGREVKITRRSVKITIFLTSLFVGQNWILKGLFKFAGRRLPMAKLTLDT
ncbi:MAG TPA: squalene/phytoene synthase family protein [Thiotrichaceae bacterium]|jgi:farnesyl-diphosphate farnesyltransferase|nr:squalene/phytoene synthase family protein [Thiotrichaceae bacterium]HIM07841.1 squalene/phytoene synthase family protein [Gammaproteobacteria bacterium]